MTEARVTAGGEAEAPMRSRAVIALGANLGDREATIRAAVAAIDDIAGVRVVAASGLVESHAMKLSGVDVAAPSYLNAVVLAEVSHPAAPLTALTLLDELNAIETRFGRVRDTVWGDRTLDLDLIAFNDLELTSDRLTLPHPRAWQRAFVLEPWAQIEPDAGITGWGTLSELRAAVGDEVWEYPAAPLMGANV